MRITRIGLTDFKRHTSLDIRPAAGLTIVRGPNEAGKSTIHDALKLALFRKADANREDVRNTYRWGADGPPEVLLEFEVDGEAGRLVKRFAGQKAEAELTLGGETIHDFALIQERIADLTGVPSEAFFRATASVGHAELSEVAGDEAVISDRLQKAISGADRGTARAKRKLDLAIGRYRTEGHKNPGSIKVVRQEVATLEAELATGEQALARLEADRAQWAEAHERREALDVQLSRQQADLAEARRAEALGTQRDEAQERYLRLKRAAELASDADRFERETPTSMPLSALRSGVGRAVTLRYELSELEAELGVDVEAAVSEGPEVKPPHPGRWLVLALSMLLVGWLTWSLLGGALGAGVATTLTLLSFATLFQTLRLALRRRQYGLALQLAESAVVRRQEAAREQQERHRRRRHDREAILADLGVADVEAAEALLATVEQHTEQLAHIEGELRGLGVQERNVRRLEEARDQAANATEQARHALAAMGEPAQDPAAAREAAGRLVEQTGPARDRARSEEDQAQGRVDANLVDAELVASLAERLAAARDQQAELQRRVTIYEGTREAIESAERATLKTAARYLEEHMGPAVARITDGRYDEIQVDERSLAFKVRAPETGSFVAVEQLSQGTADQLFLAARLGLVRLVTLDRRPPLILDDPFVTFDADRAGRALSLLKEVAAGHGFQAILLTCSDRYDAFADELVVLAGPAPEPRVATETRAATETRVATVMLPDAETGVIDPFRLAGQGGSEGAR